MGRPGRPERYRDERDYATLLGDENYELEDEDEDVVPEPPMETKQENISQECQEYYERRERLKELERQRFRRANENRDSVSISKKKPLPYNNYGTFFGPSEPIVTRRIITDIRARETASKVAARQAQEVSEPERPAKDSSGTSRANETAIIKQTNSVNEKAVKLQRLKEARDYSFLFTDEDPAASPTRDDARATTKRQKDNDPKHHLSAKSTSLATSKGSNGAKPMISTSSKSSTGGKAEVSKAESRHSTPSAKLPKPLAKSPVSKSKVPPPSGSISNASKTISGPGRPPQARPNVPALGLPNGKKPLPSSTSAQLRSLVASSPKDAIKQSLPNTPSKPAPGKSSSLKSTTLTSKEKQYPQLSGSKSLASTSHPAQKTAQKPGVVTTSRGASTGHLDQRRPPAQSVISSKMKVKPPPKRILDSESDNSFLDDDDEGQDVSSMIRKMFGYNPNKYGDIDDEDDRSMEANFHTIQMEEKRSARIAREEDERELALIEEEERRERERERAKKKRKQQR